MKLQLSSLSNIFFDGVFEGSNVIMPIIFALAGVLLIVLIVIIVLIRKKRKNNREQDALYTAVTEDDVPQTETDFSESPDEASATVPVYETVDRTDPEVIVESSSEGIAETEPVEEATTPEPEPVKPTITLVGVGGHFDRQRLEQGDTVIIGRDPRRCTLTYPATEKGISTVHCRLQKTDEQVYLTDLGSKYGTFVNGVRLEPVAPFALQPGDTFWLADRVNSFFIT